MNQADVSASQKEIQDAKFKKMTEEPVDKLILEMAVPTIASMLITSIYNMADTYFVGRIGTSATGAVGVIFPLMTLIQAVGFLFGHGSGNFISRQLGARELKECEKMASTGFIWSIMGGLIIAVFGLLFGTSLARALGATETILPYASAYLHYILFGAPIMTASFTLNNQLRFQGNAFYGMIGIMTGGILNIILDPIFIFLFDLGVAGAAIATSLSQLISLIILIVFTNKKGIALTIKNFSPDFYYIKEIFRGGLPSLFRQGCSSISFVFLNHAAGIYGDAAIAAITVVQRIVMFAASAMIGYGQGFQPVCGFNYGAKKYDRVKGGVRFCVKSSLVVLVGLAIVGFAFAPQLVAQFRNDPDVIAIGAANLRWQCVTFPLMGWVIISNMLIQTIGLTVKASILATSRQFLFFIPSLIVLSNLFGLVGIEASQSLADVISFVVSVIITYDVLKKMK
ncbi:multidrug export protein MepA [Clostridiales bacterium]|nr:multidrug export protein MepA [Clostridiales bacterium]